MDNRQERRQERRQTGGAEESRVLYDHKPTAALGIAGEIVYNTISTVVDSQEMELK